MENGQGGKRQMHQASVLLRRILVLNEVMEYQMRRDLKINETDFQAMQHLLKHGSLTPGALASALHLTSAATTTVVDRLVRSGHAQRAPHPSDRRRWLVEPTPESAREAMARLMPMVIEADDLVKAMDGRGQENVVSYLEGVVAAVERRIGEMDAAHETTKNGRTGTPPGIQEEGGEEP